MSVFRAGIHIPVPGVDASVIESLFTSGNLFGLLDLFAGGALSKFSIFAMSITPYILRPTTRFAYWIGMRRWPCVTATTTAIIASAITANKNAWNMLIVPFWIY